MASEQAKLTAKDWPSPQLIAFLITHNAHENAHSGSSLLSHLLGTWRILHGWTMPDAVCKAGLFHSIYGTEYYRQVTIELSERASVRDLIGEDAERLAYLFSVMDRPAFHALCKEDGDPIRMKVRGEAEALPISRVDRCALAHILLANWLEQRPHRPSEIAAKIDRSFAPLADILTSPALATLRAVEHA